ncbi:organic cation transporter -like [Paramuricea clavata]|uniref:Organic cation transporter -like n=1 Tax=Paramuricea clavata TaxID=317549 RepID=A0A6S7H0N3_PARCT|nr:organic cation transporter -like [Paramuricea clavata]
MYFVEVMLGSLVFGSFSDKYGRRPVFLFTMFSSFVLGLFLFFIKNYIAFVVLRFFLGFVLQGLLIVTFTSLVEIFASQYRTFTGLGVEFPWAVGIMTFSLFSYLIKDWRYIQLMSTSVCLFQIGLVWCLPESIRWLLINNRFDQAENIVRNISTFNKIPFPKDIFDKTVNEIEKTEANKSDIKSYTIADIFRSSVLRKRSLTMMVAWFSTSLDYYGLSLNISSFAGNKYLNFFISGALEPIIITSTIVILNRFGRRIPVCVIFLVAGSALIIAGVLPKSNKSVQTLVTVLAIAGRMFVSGNFGNIYIYTCELYPTVIRNVGLGSGIFWARISGIAAPQILLLGEYTAEAVPVIIFGGLLLLSGALALLLPETLNVKLPETLQDVRKFEMPQEGQGKSGLNVAEDDKNVELVS